ncbi:MAG TPA: SDR family oxidoreductase [Acidobacteriaceae bacterium]|nr:SDR family oxidoreductase [Acidobacteriaceae bacterium]
MAVSISGQVAVVVGASSGIGRAAAVLFAREGVNVIAAARREDRLQSLKDELAKEQRKITVQRADASNPEDMQQLAQLALQQFGKVDILVVASGINTPDRSMKRLTPQIWDSLVSVNLDGAFYATYALLPSMREAGSGHLIYISSISGVLPDVSGAAYQAAKRGVLGLAHAIRMEEKQNGIRTCVICPGLVDTELLAYRPVKPSPEDLAKALQAEDVAETILHVAKLPLRASIPEMILLPATQ